MGVHRGRGPGPLGRHRRGRAGRARGPFVELGGRAFERVELHPEPPEPEGDRWFSQADRLDYRRPVGPSCGAEVRVNWKRTTAGACCSLRPSWSARTAAGLPPGAMATDDDCS